jgi:hypothetical protein
VQVYKIVVLQNPDNRMNMQKKVERTNWKKRGTEGDNLNHHQHAT